MGENKNAEVKAVQALLREKDVLVTSPDGVEELSSRGYGKVENKNLVLTFCEALFLIYKGIIEVKNDKTGEMIDFQKLLDRYRVFKPNAWMRYLIYRDLRSRGYVAREGFGLGIDFRVYERGKYGKAAAKYMIFGIQEGKPVSVEELIQILWHVQSLKKQLALAVLNRKAEVVYYTLSNLTLK